jgi:hypothetical protein
MRPRKEGSKRLREHKHRMTEAQESLRRIGIAGQHLAFMALLLVLLVASFAVDATISSFSHWMSAHTYTASILADLLVFSMSFGVYDQIVRARAARSLVEDHDLWNLRSRVDRASESLTRALIVWEKEATMQEDYLSGAQMAPSKAGEPIDLSKGRGRARYCAERLPVALSDPAFFQGRCDHHRVLHHSLHECLLCDLGNLESYLSEYAQRYRDTGYPDFWRAVDAAERCQVDLDSIVHQLRNIHNPHHPARPSVLMRLVDEYMESRHVVSASAHRYGRPKSELYTPLEPTG